MAEAIPREKVLEDENVPWIFAKSLSVNDYQFSLNAAVQNHEAKEGKITLWRQLSPELNCPTGC